MRSPSVLLFGAACALALSSCAGQELTSEALPTSSGSSAATEPAVPTTATTVSTTQESTTTTAAPTEVTVTDSSATEIGTGEDLEERQLYKLLAEKTIREQIALQLETTLVPSCDLPTSVENGTEFLCVAPAELDREIEFLAKISDDDIDVNTTNVLVRDAITRMEETGSEALEILGGGTVDCGDDAYRLLNADKEMACLWTDDADKVGVVVFTVEDDSGAFEMSIKS